MTPREENCVPELIAKTALQGQTAARGALTMREVDPGQISSVAVFPGQEKAVERGLEVVGLSFPAPNAVVEGKNGTRLVWTGRDQAFLIGSELSALEGAALTDQSGGWSCLSLTGQKAADVLMRLVPLDLRLARFPVGRAARSGLNHMNVVLIRTGDEAFEILVFRSMAHTAWHEIEAAMAGVQARG